MALKITWSPIEIDSANITNVIFSGKELIVRCNERKYILSTRLAQKQFLNQLGLGYRKTLNREEKIAIITQAIRERANREKNNNVHSLVFRKIDVSGDDTIVGSVVTTEYVEIQVDEVKDRFEECLRSFNITFENVTISRGNIKDFFDYQLREPNRLLLSVGHSGTCSIRLYSRYAVLPCHNYVIGKGFGCIIHKGHPKEELLRKLPTFITLALQSFRLFPPLIENARRPIDVEVLDEIFSKAMQNYPKHIQDKLNALYNGKYQTERGLWRVSQSLSDVGSNSEGITENYQRILQHHAFKILEAW